MLLILVTAVHVGGVAVDFVYMRCESASIAISVDATRIIGLRENCRLLDLSAMKVVNILSDQY